MFYKNYICKLATNIAIFMRRILKMSNIPFSFSLQEITGSYSQLVSTLSSLSVEAKISVSFAMIGFFYKFCEMHQKQQEKLNGLFNVTWRNSRSITKEEILTNRPFNEYYYVRDEDEKVRVFLEKEQKLLIVGPPLGGKTRMVYESLILSKNYDLIIPRAKDIDIESFILPKRLKVWKPKLMFIDDLHRFAELQNFEYLFEICRKNNINFIVTCRSGMEYEKTKKRMLDKNIDLETEIFDEIIKVKEISGSQGKKVAEKVGKNWNKTRFNRTIGSIFMPLAEMHKRFNECTPEEKSILKAIKKLHICGVYDEGQIFQLDHIKTISENEGIKKENYQWEELIKNLCEKELIKIEKNKIDRIWTEEVYLEDIVDLDSDELHIFEELLSSFAQFPETLFKIGNRAYEIGSLRLQKAKYMKTTIEIHKKVLEIRDMEQLPIQYITAQNNIGNAYRTLAEVEDKALNFKRAIEEYHHALKIATVNQFPIQYVMTQNNIGNAYRTLADVEDKALNCKKAIGAYEKALRVTPVEQFPIQYAMTQNNIGVAYRRLAEVEDKAQNCKKSIEEYHHALKIVTIEQFPMDYAMTQNNIGIAYGILAEVEDKNQNCKKAIEAFQNAFKVTHVEQFPIEYAMVQNNIGKAYGELAKVEDKNQNCKKAIEAYQNALKIFTAESYPKDNKMITGTLGNLINFCKDNNMEV